MYILDGQKFGVINRKITTIIKDRYEELFKTLFKV